MGYSMNLGLAVVLSLLFLTSGAVKKWDLPLEFSINQESYEPLGKIELTLQSDGNYTGNFQASTDMNIANMFKSIANSKPNAFYSVRSGDVFSSNQACLIAAAHLQHEFALTIDPTRQKLLSLTVYPRNLYDAGREDCVLDTSKLKKPTHVGGRVTVTSTKELPSPDIATYLQRIEEEKRSRQHGAAQDNRSFFSKYWMYIVPAVVFLVVTNAMGADQQQE